MAMDTAEAKRTTCNGRNNDGGSERKATFDSSATDTRVSVECSLLEFNWAGARRHAVCK